MNDRTDSSTGRVVETLHSPNEQPDRFHLRACKRNSPPDERRDRPEHHFNHLSLTREGCWGTTDDFATSFLHFPVLHCPPGLRELQACPFPDVVFPHLPLSALSYFPLLPCLARWFWPDLTNGRHDHTSRVSDSLRLSGLRVVRSPAGSWHGLPRW